MNTEYWSVIGPHIILSCDWLQQQQEESAAGQSQHCGRVTPPRSAEDTRALPGEHSNIFVKIQIFFVKI